VRWFRARIPMTDAQMQEIDADIRKYAWTVANCTQADVVTQVYEALDSAIANGTTVDEFKKTIGEQLEQSWGGEDPGQLETIFRTNVQSAYNAGRYEQQTDPVILHARPYWQFDAIEDDRTSDICSELDHTVLAADDDFWDEHQPPLHFNCRSTVVALSADEADEAGVSEDAPETPAADGFGDAPELSSGDWEPDPKDYPSEIASVLRSKLDF